MKNNRVRMFMDVMFKYPGDNSEHEESVWIPFEILMNAIRKYCDSRLVTIDGTYNAIWNLFVDLDCLGNIEYNDEILNICKELYKGSSYEEEDYAEWLDEYESLHNLGKYAEEE